MAIIVVEVMLKPEILDPQGVAVGAALPRLGFTFAKSVRQSKNAKRTTERKSHGLACKKKQRNVLFWE